MKHFYMLQAFAFVLSCAASASNAIIVRSPVGMACTSDDSCGAGYECIPENKNATKGGRFEGGYCVKFDCEAQPCDAGSKCVVPEGGTFSVCMAQCETRAHCRNGYTCHANKVCVPEL